MVVSVTIAKFEVKRLLVDNGQYYGGVNLGCLPENGVERESFENGKPIVFFVNHPLETEVVGQVLDLDSLDVKGEERIRKQKATKVTKTIQLFYDNIDKFVKISSALAEEESATYQRLVNKIFRKQIGRNVEVYVDDMLVKSSTLRAQVQDLSEAFTSLRAHNMKLNLEKCVFAIRAGSPPGWQTSLKL
ncbi:uncharacterized protein LOC105761983 [Gossypium raimondii]|uniref:uncharacterized protein LOC105761983 n=1 Tax=Gossypium raimondii TaxID=29730 RepID=UPI00063AE7FC|nr:uncharacterized protein LOC105761983 [Gossypium raimondii]